MNPNMPNRDTPPNIPTSIMNGFIFAFSPIILNLNKLSRYIVVIRPVIIMPTAV